MSGPHANLAVSDSEPERSPGDERAVLDAQRLAIASFQIDAEDFGRPWLAEAFRRLALMHEVGECLAGNAPDAAAAVAAFNRLAYDRLTNATDDQEHEQAAAWVQAESAARWGEYLALLDPSWAETRAVDAPAVPPPVEPDDEPAAIDVSTLVRLLTGGAPPPARPAVAPLARSRAPARPAMVVPAPPRSVAMEPALRDIFLAEASDLFERIVPLVLGLTLGPGQGQTLHELGRCLHTLKGAAGSVGLAELAALIHGMEEQFVAAATGVSDDLIDLLHALLRYMEGLFDALRRGPAGGGDATAPLPSASTSPPPGAGPPAPATGHDAPEPVAWTPPAAQPPTEAGEATVGEGPDRVTAERVDELMDIASELISRRGLWAAHAESM
jgi:HPt (histidine-containing phosphotransfer) domain-containing protein